jgi:hypothetical protein
MSTAIKGRVVGVFKSHSQAEAAVNELRILGFTDAQIGIASKRVQLPGTNQQADGFDATTDGATTGAAVGVGAGTLWGLGILAGVLPAIGPVIAGGTLAALVGSAATGAAAGGLGGALLGIGLSEEDSGYYDAEFANGRVIVTVDAGSRMDTAEQAILDHGGYNRERVLIED